MKIRISSVGFVLGLIILSSQVMFANCKDAIVKSEELLGYKFTEIKDKKDKDKKDRDKEDEDEKPSNINLNALKVKLEKETQFKIKLESAISSNFNKANDQVSFIVLENVYGITKKFDITLKGVKTSIAAKRCIVIPKGTKLYGIVDIAKPSYPFFFGGKARLYLFVNTITLEDGSKVKIDFAYPIPDSEYKSRKRIFKECKRVKGKTCLRGRRTKLKFSPAIVAVGAGTAIALAKDETTNDIIALGFLQSLAGATGVDSLVNPPNAAILKDMIFDVKTVGESNIWVYLPEPDDKDSDKKPDKKPDKK